MKVHRLVEQRLPAWNQLEESVRRIEEKGPRSVPSTQLDELLHLYRDASADLARLKAADADPALVRRVNRLQPGGPTRSSTAPALVAA